MTFADHEIIDIEELIATSVATDPPPPAAGDNGGPGLRLDHAAVAAMVRPIFGPRWEGKFAPLVHEHPRQIARWRLGEASPSERQQGNVRLWALRTAHRLLAAVGEDDLAYEVGRVVARREAVALERGAIAWGAAAAKVDAKLAADAEQGRDGWAAIDAKAEARRAAKAARMAEKAGDHKV
ncbi:hypothetical protein MKK55_18645 [Methylobacterium sp. J-059]|uniref:hypothetical protein n=1 Tax=Methylobacterium sp. J-059 TaxID=2836643 RepID=UPI001FBA3861|nr:hypothetical protein [Methylobacterium sp. J-059]MCJ2040950.1 hypothetical protein [Methylobacterium sp. J-059]